MDLDGPLQGTNGSSKTRNVLSKRTVSNKRNLSSTSKASASIGASGISNGAHIQLRRLPTLADPYTDENVAPTEFNTPSAVRFKDALAPITPKHRVRLPGKPWTPRSPPRTCTTSNSTQTTVYATARQVFAQSENPTRLIGRDVERTELQTFISQAVESHRGGSMYVSGPPGTGKSALVSEVTKDLHFTTNLKSSVVNCVGVKSSKDILQKIICDLCPEVDRGAKSEQSFLSNLFLSTKKSTMDSFLVVLDEVDNLLLIDSELLYTLFGWALHKSSCLILVGIANALDLTDRFLPRLKARNLKPRLLPFMPYNAPQIASIITEKLRSTLPADCSKAKDYVPFLHPAAIQLCSKKVASQTGDLRKVFNLVRRAIDRVEREIMEKNSFPDLTPTKQPFADITNTSPTKLPLSPPSSSPIKPASPCPKASSMQLDLTTLTAENAPRATVAHIARLAAEVFSNNAISRLDGLNLQQKAVLCSLVAAEKRRNERDPFSTPSKNVNKKPMLKDLFASYAGLCRRENVLCALSDTEFRDVVASLDTLGLVQEASARGSFLTPTKTPSRLGMKNIEDRQFSSTVSEKELDENLQGPGTEILKRLLHGEML
jgi:cell division control protein 6